MRQKELLPSDPTQTAPIPMAVEVMEELEKLE